MKRNAAVLVMLVLALGACRPASANPVSVTPTPDAMGSYTSLYALVLEGRGADTIIVDRSELPMALAFAAEDTSVWLVLYELDGALQHYSEFPPASPPALTIASISEDEIVLAIDHPLDWVVLGTNLDDDLTLDVSGTRRGEGNGGVFFEQDTARCVDVEVDPPDASVALIAATSSDSHQVLTRGDETYPHAFELPQDALGILIRTSAGWQLHVLDVDECVEIGG